MPFNLGLLSDAALTGLSDEEKSSLQKQATQQFLLGSLLSNDPSMGLKSAYSVPEQYLSGQKAISDIQEKRRQRSEVSSFLEQYAPTSMQAGQRALGAEGRGPTNTAAQNQQAILNAPIDYSKALTDSLRLSGNPAQPQIRETLMALKPTMTPSGVLLNSNMQATGGVPTYDPKTGLTSRPIVKDGNVDFNITAAPGYGQAVEQNLTYALQPGEQAIFDINRNLIGVRAMDGSIQTLQQREAAKAIGGSFAIPEQVVNPVTQQKEFKSRANILGFTNPASATGAGGVGVAGGAVAEVSPSQKTMNETADARFKAFSKTSLDSSETAGGRKLAAQQLYDLSTRIDNNKLTGLQAGVYSYMNAIPGVGKLFEQDITDVTRMNQSIATAQLEKTAQQKGTASNLDAQIIARGYATLTDPATATRMLAAQEVALADKDMMRNQFVENYKGDPGKIGTAWEKSSENQPIFEHPKFKQFLNEQVTANPSAPVLPAGFSLVQGKSGKYGIKRPDGTVMTLGQ